MAANPNETKGRPVVSVIVPARNEEACLDACLRSLLFQSGIHFEIIVVNDHSTDRTREIAEGYAAVQVIDADPLPEEWTGKNHAAWCGARIARGKWLLFTDADTVHLPDSLWRAVREADENSADLLSYSPKQEVHGFFQRALMPVIFAELRMQYPPERVRNPYSKIAAANGQYLLITRPAYDAIGGHAAVRDSILEDVEIAKRVKAEEATIHFRYGSDAVRTRMYRSFWQMCEGWTKNLALLFPDTMKLVGKRSLEFFLSFGGLLALIFGLKFHILRLAEAGGVTTIPVTMNYFFQVRKAHFGWINTIISPIGLPIFVLLLLRSRLHYRRNDVIWKGRHYHPGSPEEAPESAKATSNT